MTQLVDTEILQATSTAQDPYVFKSAKDLPDCDIDGWEVQSQSCQDQFRSKRWLQCRCCSMQSEYEACRNLGYRLIRKLGKSNKDTDFEFTYMTEWQFDLLQIRRKITPINQSPPSLQPKAIPPLHLHEYQSLYLLLMHYCKKDLVELFADEYGFLERHRDNIYFRPTAAGLRQACDICSTTIINCFWICSGCAMEICLDCYKDALNGTVQKEQLREFEFCCKDFRHSYYESAEQSLRKFVPAFKIPSILFLYLWDKFRYAYERLPTHFANRLFYFQVDAGKFLDVHYTQINITNFHQYWSRGIPVVVRDLGKLLRRGQWSPQTLLDLYKNTPATILDQNNNPVEVGVEDFFQGMMDSQRRPKTFNGHYRRHLKLKVKLRVLYI